MTLPLALLGPIVLVVGLSVIGIVVVLLLRRRRQVMQRLRDDSDFELVFPEHPGDKPVRGTVTGRRVTGR